MHRVGSLLQFVGGAIGRVAASGIIIGLFFIAAGVTPWQFVADLIQQPPLWLRSVWLQPSLTLIGITLIGGSLWFNLWSKKQQVIDDLAEDIAWAIKNLVNRKPRPSTDEEVTEWERDFRRWYEGVSKKLENRAFFTRADQLHFDMLGFVDPIVMSGHGRLDWLLGQLKMKFERLRDVINWTQQRRR
jgi:hypothetical protein